MCSLYECPYTSTWHLHLLNKDGLLQKAIKWTFKIRLFCCTCCSQRSRNNLHVQIYHKGYTNYSTWGIITFVFFNSTNRNHDCKSCTRRLTVFHPGRYSWHQHRVSAASGQSESSLERTPHEELCNLHYHADSPPWCPSQDSTELHPAAQS